MQLFLDHSDRVDGGCRFSFLDHLPLYAPLGGVCIGNAGAASVVVSLALPLADTPSQCR